MEKTKIILESLSPVHIGSKGEIYPYEYVVTNGVFYRMDLEKIYADKRWGQYLPYKPEDMKQMRYTLEQIFKNMEREGVVEEFILWQANAGYDFQDKYLNAPDSQLIINLLPRNPGPYLPGSSLKGAIRTLFLNWLAEQKDRAKKCEHVKKEKRDKAKKIEYCLLNALNIKGNPVFSKDIFQFFHISDSIPIEKTEILLVKNISLKSSQRSKIPMYMEVIPERTKIEMEVRFDFERYKKANKSPVEKKVILEDFFYIAEKYTRERLEREQKRIKASRMQDKEEITRFYSELLEMDKDESEYLLRVGRFSGFDYMTIEKFRHKKQWGSSLTITETRRPFGWIKVKLLS